MPTFKIEIGTYNAPVPGWRYVARQSQGLPLDARILALWDNERHQQRGTQMVQELIDWLASCPKKRSSYGSIMFKFLRITEV